MSIKTFKIKPVAWMTTLLSVLVALEALDRAAHLLPAGWSPYLLGAIAALTAVLGALTHGAVTPLAQPRDDAGNPLVPKWAAGDTPAPPSGPGGGGGIGGAGMRSW
jgi:hypothetical protein